jgi:hypothetical protein
MISCYNLAAWMQSARKIDHNISTLVCFWYSDKICSINRRCYTINLSTCVNRLWTIDLDICISFLCFWSKRMAIQPGWLWWPHWFYHVSRYTHRQEEHCLGRNCASRRYNVNVEYTMASEPSISTKFLCIAMSGIDFNRRYSIINR